MPSCIKRKGRRRVICVGDLDRRVILNDRKLENPGSAPAVSEFGSFKGHHVITQTPFTTVWAMIETIRPVTIFDSSNVERVITHDFYIRYRSDVTAETWIEFDSENFDIVLVENLDERKEFLKLRANKRGPTSKNSSNT